MLKPPDECLRDLLQSDTTYETTPSMTVRPYNASKLKVVRSDRVLFDIQTVVSDEAKAFLDDP